MGIGHVGGSPFVAGVDETNVGVGVQGIEHGQKTLARHAINRVHALTPQGLHQNVSPKTWGGRVNRHTSFLILLKTE